MAEGAGDHPHLAHARTRRRARARPRRRRLPAQALQPCRARRPHPPPPRARKSGMNWGRSPFPNGDAHLFEKVNVPNLPKVNVPLVMAMLMASPALACDASLQAAATAQPENTELGESFARSCARAGNHERALAGYERLLARDAGNVDWLLGRSQALVALGRPQEA